MCSDGSERRREEGDTRYYTNPGQMTTTRMETTYTRESGRCSLGNGDESLWLVRYGAMTHRAHNKSDNT